MLYPQKTIHLKDGTPAVLASPDPERAEEMIAWLRQVTGETRFLLRTAEECDAITPEGEKTFLEGMNGGERSVMLTASVHGRYVAGCDLQGGKHLRDRHRGTIGISILREYWGLGLGTALFEEIIAIARAWGLEQLELEVLEGNTRAMALYRKMGFEVVAKHPNAIHLENGEVHQIYFMVRKV